MGGGCGGLRDGCTPSELYDSQLQPLAAHTGTWSLI